jgi:exonuclease III
MEECLTVSLWVCQGNFRWACAVSYNENCVRCNIIVLNVYAPSEEKNNDSKDSFYEELEQVFFFFFPKCDMKILLGNFNAKLERGDIFKQTVWNESLHKDSDDNGVRIVNFATLNNLVIQSTMFLD